MKVMKLAVLVLCGTLGAELSARTYDLERHNLAVHVRQMVEEAKQTGSYDALPAIIKEVYGNMQQGNSTVANITIANEVADLVTLYLEKKYRRKLL